MSEPRFEKVAGVWVDHSEGDEAFEIVWDGEEWVSPEEFVERFEWIGDTYVEREAK